MKVDLERVDTEKGSQLWINTTFRNANLRIHGPVKFIVDTGAMRSVIAYDQAVKLGINVGGLRNPTICRGISEEINSYLITGNRIYIKWEDEKKHLFKTSFDLEIIENPGRGIFNLLGLDFFIKHSAKLVTNFNENEYYIEIPE